MEKSNVTVIIPCYNDGQYVLKAVNSILTQTLKADKIIIIDDGSQLETKAILKTIHHESIAIIFQENQGVCKARNVGIDLATTAYILTLDADDYFEPTFIEKAVAILNTNCHIGVVGCCYKVIKGNVTQKEIIKPLGGTVENFLVKNNGLGTAMFRKKCWVEVAGYDEKMSKGYEDWEFWIAVLRNNWEMYILQEALFNYRIKPLSRDKKALQEHDFALRKYIFSKHQPVFFAHYEFYATELLRINCNFRRKVTTLENSLNYETGKKLLFPLRWVKQLVQSIKG